MGELRLQGAPICAGVAIGHPHFFVVDQETIVQQTLEPAQIQPEIERYRLALQKTRSEIEQLHNQLLEEGATDGAQVLNTHLEMMQDPLITSSVEEQIQEQRRNPECVFYEAIRVFEERFHRMSDPFFRERFKDILDICRRVLGHLRQTGRPTLANLPENSIVIADELTPSEIAEARSGCVVGIVTRAGSLTSHAAIVAKAKGIPLVSHIAFKSVPPTATRLIVDGHSGLVVVDPLPETLSRYRSSQRQINRTHKMAQKVAHLEAETLDGYRVRLSANVELPAEELELLRQYGSEGVGLFRSEYMFLAHDAFPKEEEQFLVYRQLVEGLRDSSVVIRTFDIGGDKFGQFQNQAVEGNPFLGCRAIRYLLQRRDEFKAQLRAILRAAAYGDVGVLFPMVSGMGELRAAKELLEEARQELRDRGEPADQPLRVGCMIEVPSAAVLCDLLARECDFLSVGTNDLVQYALAVDRSNEAMSYLYQPSHPSVVRLLRLIVCLASQHQVPVTVCGEMAAETRFIPLLLGLGVRELSVSARCLPTVKEAIRRTTFLDAVQLAETVLSLETGEEIDALLQANLDQTLDLTAPCGHH